MKFLKGAAIFLLGCGSGAAASYIYFNKKYEEKKLELEEIKEHYNNKIYGEAIIKQEGYVSYDDFTKIAADLSTQEGYISYDNLTADGVKTVIKEVSEEAMIEDRPRDDYPQEPIVIDESDYSETELSFEKADLDYYLDDGALVDEADTLIEIEDVIGYYILEDFINNDNEHVIYVRNAALGTDYQIKKISGSYSDSIGIGGDDEDE